MADTILRMKSISKSFPGVHALDKVSFEVRRGEVHAILGENGAGKSTLMKILSGAYRRDEGEIELDGQTVEIHSPSHAQSLGIAMIYQEFNLAPHLSVEDNIFIGREPRSGVLAFIDKRAVHEQSQRLIGQLGVDLDVTRRVDTLNVCQQQITEIAKALSMKSHVVIMDEPTSALSESEVRTLFAVIRHLKQGGIGIVYISHNLGEVFEIADRITVLRDGRKIDTRSVGELTPDEAVQRMVGRDIEDMYGKRDIPIGEVVLKAYGLCCGKRLQDISFELHGGEVLGVAGLLGSGRTELIRALFGADRKERGTVDLIERGQRINRIADAIHGGMGLVPEDRKEQGLFLGMPVRQNISAASIPDLSSYGILNVKKERALAAEYVERLDIKIASLEQLVLNLSGGNQQKAVLAKWLARCPRILLLDDPTRGIDVGAKQAIYRLIGELAASGVGILFVSSELPEILGISDRILVMAEGRIRGELCRAEATQEKIMSLATISSIPGCAAKVRHSGSTQEDTHR
jgi:ribose transport system ATP-binding protein